MEANGTPVSAPPKPKATETEYVLLEACEDRDGGPAWREIGHASSSSGKDVAIRDNCGKGSFKGVPVGNWRGGLVLGEETRTVKTSTPIRD